MARIGLGEQTILWFWCYGVNHQAGKVYWGISLGMLVNLHYVSNIESHSFEIYMSQTKWLSARLARGRGKWVRIVLKVSHTWPLNLGVKHFHTQRYVTLELSALESYFWESVQSTYCVEIDPRHVDECSITRSYLVVFLKTSWKISQCKQTYGSKFPSDRSFSFPFFVEPNDHLDICCSSKSTK